jgi:hypothetical protein
MAVGNIDTLAQCKSLISTLEHNNIRLLADINELEYINAQLIHKVHALEHFNTITLSAYMTHMTALYNTLESTMNAKILELDNIKHSLATINNQYIAAKILAVDLEIIIHELIVKLIHMP